VARSHSPATHRNGDAQAPRRSSAAEPRSRRRRRRHRARNIRRAPRSGPR
jgi:hypothetical protein